MVYIHYNQETGKILGANKIKNIPDPFISADMEMSEVLNYKVVNNKLVLKTQEELEQMEAENVASQFISYRKEITDHRALVMAKGMSYGNNQFIQADIQSRYNLDKIITNRDLLTYPYLWMTWDNSVLSLASAEDLLSMSDAMDMWVVGIFQGSFVSELELEECTTIEALQTVVDEYKEAHPI